MSSISNLRYRFGRVVCYSLASLVVPINLTEKVAGGSNVAEDENQVLGIPLVLLETQFAAGREMRQIIVAQ